MTTRQQLYKQYKLTREKYYGSRKTKRYETFQEWLMKIASEYLWS